MNRKTVIYSAVAVLVVAAAVALSARAKTRTGVAVSANGAAPSPVTVTDVKSVKSAPREEITGALNPAKELKVGFEVAGRLARILVKKGADVAEGQLIAQLDPELADAQVKQAEAAVSAAEAQSAIASDLASRNAELAKTNTISESQLRNTTSSAAAAAAQLQAAKAQLAQARANRRRHDVRAPFAGVLIDAPDQIGATVASGTTLFTLEQLDPLVLKLTVSDNARALLKVGTRVQVDAVGGGASTNEAWVRTVIPSADSSTRRIPVEIVVPNDDSRFTAHTLGRAVLTLGAAEEVQSAPSSALSSQGGDHVYALVSGQVRKVPVQVIDRGAQEVVFKASQPVEKVVDYPAPDLQDGAKVSVK
ncbi:MAG TPA: efflux RND transporter periplasmic adaptor subunit [Myxococcales bacterium]|jgi:RND family efflux transporter MFP subunit|nr:efflux RND transporter periplasmic adaptor subunit [Myxococcales bacterium]